MNAESNGYKNVLVKKEFTLKKGQSKDHISWFLIRVCPAGGVQYILTNARVIPVQKNSIHIMLKSKIKIAKN